MKVVRLDRNLGWRLVVLALLLAWPLILFGRPSYFDSLSYYRGGRVAVAFAISKIAQLRTWTSQQASPPIIGDVPPNARDTSGARSIPYSVIAYLLSAPDAKMIVLVLAQTVAVALTITVVVMAVGVTEPWAFALLGVIVAACTSAACFANLASPDIFAGVIIGISAVLATRLNQLSGGVRLTLALVSAFAVSSHASHPPLAAGMSLLGGIGLALSRSPIDQRLRTVGWLFAPLILGGAATMLSGYVGFGEVSIAPKRFPLTLARSIEDGPARWYLEQNCTKHRYAVCEVFGNNFPNSAREFLWDEGGLRYRASPEQMDRIRAEEQEIVLRAAEAYPFAQAVRTLTNIWRQLSHFGLNGTRFDQRIALDASGEPHFEGLDEGHGRILSLVGTLSFLSVLLCAGWVFWRFRVLEGKDQGLLLLVGAGIIGNAIICAMFSAVDDRYQARVIWVLPMVTMALLFARRDAAERRLIYGVTRATAPNAHLLQ